MPLQMMVCILRALAEDENRVQRAEHALDLALLDAVTWPDYLWDYLRLVYNPLGRLSAPIAASPTSAAAEAAATQGLKHHMHALGQGVKKYASEEAAPTDAKALLPKHSFPRRRCREFYSLPAEDKVCIPSFPAKCIHCAEADSLQTYTLSLCIGSSCWHWEQSNALWMFMELIDAAASWLLTLFSSRHVRLQGAIMDAMAGYLLDVRSVRREIDRREACGQWVSGSSGEGGAFAMRTPEETARRAAAGSDDEVHSDTSHLVPSICSIFHVLICLLPGVLKAPHDWPRVQPTEKLVTPAD